MPTPVLIKLVASQLWQMLAGPFLDSVQSAYDPATSRTMIKGVTCKYVILPVSSSKLHMFFPVRAIHLTREGTRDPVAHHHTLSHAS